MFWKGKLIALFCKYTKVFSQDKFYLGKTEDGVHTIRLKSQEPVYTKQLPLPLCEMNFIRDAVKQWQKLGLVKPAISPSTPRYSALQRKGMKAGGWCWITGVSMTSPLQTDTSSGESTSS